MVAVESTARPRAWAVVTGQELRDLWLGGRGLILSLAFSVLLSVLAYLVATNQALNFLEQRESVNLTLQVAIAVGALLALLAAADTVSGERERGTLEALLLTPVSRRQLTGGKIVVDGHPWTQDVAWLTSPLVAAGVFLVAAAVVGGRFLRLSAGADG